MTAKLPPMTSEKRTSIQRCSLTKTLLTLKGYWPSKILNKDQVVLKDINLVFFKPQGDNQDYLTCRSVTHGTLKPLVRVVKIFALSFRQIISKGLTLLFLHDR